MWVYQRVGGMTKCTCHVKPSFNRWSPCLPRLTGTDGTVVASRWLEPWKHRHQARKKLAAAKNDSTIKTSPQNIRISHKSNFHQFLPWNRWDSSSGSFAPWSSRLPKQTASPSRKWWDFHRWSHSPWQPARLLMEDPGGCVFCHMDNTL